MVVSHVNLTDFNEEENPSGFRLIGSHEAKTVVSENIEQKGQDPGDNNETTHSAENGNEGKKRARTLENNNHLDTNDNDNNIDDDDEIVIEDGPAKKKVSP